MSFTDRIKFYPAQLVLLALGFLGPQKELVTALGVKQDPRSNVATPQGKYSTSVPGVYAAGDCRRGQSLIVWGIQEGRRCALEVDIGLMGSSRLANSGGIGLRSWVPPPSEVNGEAEEALEGATQDSASSAAIAVAA
jgi:glutamate synthase (NADPH/NADH)